MYITGEKTLFQQRWQSKKVIRAYHGDFINENIFKRWYLPDTLPDVRPRAASSQTEEAIYLARWAKKDKVADSAQKTKEKEKEAHIIAPVGSLMLTEVERRIDVVIFRACLASSVYEARRLVIHGDVLLNGKKVRRMVQLVRSSAGVDMCAPYVAPRCEHAPCAWRYGVC